MGEKTRAYLPALDGIRAFAVVAVVVFHTITPLFPGGNVGVDIFFVLSGFLITRILVGEIDRTGRISFGGFYLRRALRLLPALFVLALILTVAYIVLLDGEDRRESLLAVLAAVTYTSSPLIASGHNLGSMTHMWSLSVEEYFYLAWPLLLLLISAAKRFRLQIAAGITSAAVIYRLAVAVAGWPIQRIYYAADTRADELLVGCLLALLLRRYRLPLRDAMALPAAVLLVGFAVLPSAWTGPFYRYGGSFLVALATAIIVAVVAQIPAGPVSRILSTRPLVWVGRRSYGIYLWNLPLSAMAQFALPAWVPFVPVVLLLSFVVPALSFRIVEQPFLRLKSRFGTSFDVGLTTRITTESPAITVTTSERPQPSG